jgi:hypothetical protein
VVATHTRQLRCALQQLAWAWLHQQVWDQGTLALLNPC